MKNPSEIIHVVLAVYDPDGSYSRHAGVVMVSIFERTKSPVCVHVLHDKTLTEHNRSLLTETAETFAQTVEFHDVSPYIERLGEDAVKLARKKWASEGILFRLAIPNILLLDKVIYLDCDIVVNLDIRELWDTPMEGYSLAGALDTRHSRFSSTSFRMRLMGCDWEKYVNSGVLLMSLPQIKEKLTIQKSASWYKRYRHCVKYPDQDLINSCFRGDIKIIDGRFNNRDLVKTFYCGAIASCIVHVTPTKPWKDLKGSIADRLYWKTFLKTPWGRLAPEGIVDLLFDVVEKSPLTHRKSVQCYRTILYRLRKDVIRNDVVVILWLLATELSSKAKFFFTRREPQ